MLVLARRKNESIRILGDIKITVVKVQGGKVSIGIDAPDNVPVYREEIYQQILTKGNLKQPHPSAYHCGQARHAGATQP